MVDSIGGGGGIRNPLTAALNADGNELRNVGDITADVGAIMDSSELSDTAVTAAKLAANAVQNSKIASGAVDSDEIASDAVTAAKIAAGAVNSNELATDAVTAAEIAASAVGSSELDTDAVDSDELADDAVGPDQLDETGDYTVGSVQAEERTTESAPVINVQHPAYGAVGDGATDDLQAIKDAVTAADPGDTLLFPPTPDGYAISSEWRPGKNLTIWMGAPNINDNGGIFSAHLTQTNGTDATRLFAPASDTQIAGTVGVDGNRSNQATDVTGVLLDTARLPNLMVGAVNCDTALRVIDDCETGRVCVAASESGTVLLEESGSNDEMRYFAQGHNVDNGAILRGSASRCSLACSFEQVSQKGIVADGAAVTLHGPIVRGSDGVALLARSDCVVHGGVLAGNAVNSSYAVIADGRTVIHGTKINSNTHELKADGADVRLRDTIHVQGRRVVNAVNGAHVTLSDPPFIASNANDTIRAGGSSTVNCALTVDQVTDSDFQLNGTGSETIRIRVTDNVADGTVRANIPNGSGTVIIYRDDQQALEFGQGGSWERTDTTTV